MNNTLNSASADAIQPKKKTTYYHLVLDRSGSMSSCWSEVRQVIDKQLLDLKRVQEENASSELIFSFCAFDNELRFSQDLMPVAHARMDWELIFPNAATSLNDAIGESIAYVKNKVGPALSEAEADVIVLILTDGYENASRIYSAKAVKELMEACEETGKWNFLFLGAGLDVTEVTMAYDRGDKNSYSFAKESLAMSFKKVNNELEDYVKQKEQNQKKSSFFKF